MWTAERVQYTYHQYFINISPASDQNGPGVALCARTRSSISTKPDETAEILRRIRPLALRESMLEPEVAIGQFVRYLTKDKGFSQLVVFFFVYFGPVAILSFHALTNTGRMRFDHRRQGPGRKNIVRQKCHPMADFADPSHR